MKDVRLFYRLVEENSCYLLTAEGKKESMILEANAEKAQIAHATGQAEALRLVYGFQAKGIQYINDANQINHT